MTIKVQYYSKFLIDVSSPLAVEICARTIIDDYCFLCECHPSSGHNRDCPVVIDAIQAGAVMRPVPDEDA